MIQTRGQATAIHPAVAHLRAVARDYPDAWKAYDQFRQDRRELGDWPEWCGQEWGDSGLDLIFSDAPMPGRTVCHGCEKTKKARRGESFCSKAYAYSLSDTDTRS